MNLLNINYHKILVIHAYFYNYHNIYTYVITLIVYVTVYHNTHLQIDIP